MDRQTIPSHLDAGCSEMEQTSKNHQGLGALVICRFTGLYTASIGAVTTLHSGMVEQRRDYKNECGKATWVILLLLVYVKEGKLVT